MKPVRQSALSADARRLVELMRQVRFGRLENLVVRGGQPYFSQPPRVVQETVFGTREPAQPIQPNDDFALKRHVQELLAALVELGDGVVACLEVRHGLPHRLTVINPLACAEAQPCR